MMDTADKIHVYLYEHSGGSSSDNICNEEEKDNGLNASALPPMMNLEHELSVESFQQLDTFSYGDLCLYWYYYKYFNNFVIPASICLFSEICANIEISAEFCLEPIDFWCLYLHSIELRNAFRLEFLAANMGPSNFECNVFIGAVMSTSHYLCLLLYSDWTEFQQEFKKYTRRINAHEIDQEFFVRNSFVAHWQRYLVESVHFFGRPFSESDTVYCGISTKLVFDSFEQWISAPLSTSLSAKVALEYAGSEGIILQLKKVNQLSRYFPISLFSHFSHEQEWFVCFSTLKIVDIVESNFYSLMLSNKKYIHSMLLLEKVLRGYMFIDVDENRLVTKSNVQLLMDMIDAHVDGRIIGESKNEEYLRYMQVLFNYRIQKFTTMKLDDNNDPMGYNQTWINSYELERISFLPLKEYIDGFLVNSLNKVNQTPKPIEIIIEGDIYQEFKKLENSFWMKVGRVYSTVMNDMQFKWKVVVKTSNLCDPNYWAFFLYLHDKPEQCSSFDISLDVICPELQFGTVNLWCRYEKAGDYYKVLKMFCNFNSIAQCEQLKIYVCIRILFVRVLDQNTGEIVVLH